MFLVAERSVVLLVSEGQVDAEVGRYLNRWALLHCMYSTVWYCMYCSVCTAPPVTALQVAACRSPGSKHVVCADMIHVAARSYMMTAFLAV